MKAVILHAYGDLSQLSYETDEDLPPVGDGEVRIRVRATSINPIDWKLRSGAYKDHYPLDLPEFWVRTWPARWTRSGRESLGSKRACASWVSPMVPTLNTRPPRPMY